MNTTSACDIAPALMLTRMEWLLGSLPELPYTYVYTVVGHPEFDRLKAREGDKQALFNEALRIIRSVGDIEDLDAETQALIELILDGQPKKRGGRGENRVMLGMRQYFDHLLTKGYELDREGMVLIKGRKRLYFRHGILVED